MKRKNIALIPAAGIGARFGADKPKQYVEIGSKTVLEHTIGIFERHEAVDLTVVVVSPEDTFADKVQTAFPQVRVWKNGGQTRAETVRNGAEKLLEIGLASADDNILVHDAVRCCLPSEALTRLIEQAGNAAEGGILAIPIADTLKCADGGNISATVERTSLWQAQTPQLFRAGLLHRALAAENLDGITDEASAVEKLGVRPLLIQGDVRNLKLTQPQDAYIVRLLLDAV
ncbi:TPA: 2-C-methyl-D-erythritol 4-phosphate cytidylyltransferase [Neisseria meningitidis]|uniref:2-C-methyl-D-erythritol 4-phosphate cytidylyltransferase n=1 Tax=Neisseria meningitidis TaxID=487 RepID=UPI00027CA2B0|nr:2-C-methyl-D-erythritol 4-phosphate cytidylyltransferase [Neisseria meningitidis]EJU57852.1 2-C-methyl-D-erythritol 4-phosphate cytidylyltransferase [Neisseria meningitidis NM183]EJU58074.1 2-C-methyl-D-erythritol 4-phosphate cytidylyltransferase [Neisseria meningitidis NM140]EJU59986.1 2-C-methyl-D-erythritol 4-phosphate cytidylyltransferase [Neisseria meningitidis NM2781]EJU64367.1 2-C-methyl-D-erythritol 4-phosphate cytidylyltransferase [Neisseria meningitidis NM576]MBG8694872.1 2-C-meth